MVGVEGQQAVPGVFIAMEGFFCFFIFMNWRFMFCFISLLIRRRRLFFSATFIVFSSFCFPISHKSLLYEKKSWLYQESHRKKQWRPTAEPENTLTIKIENWYETEKLSEEETQGESVNSDRFLQQSLTIEAYERAAYEGSCQDRRPLWISGQWLLILSPILHESSDGSHWIKEGTLMRWSLWSGNNQRLREELQRGGQWFTQRAMTGWSRMGVSWFIYRVS